MRVVYNHFVTSKITLALPQAFYERIGVLIEIKTVLQENIIRIDCYVQLLGTRLGICRYMLWYLCMQFGTPDNLLLPV